MKKKSIILSVCFILFVTNVLTVLAQHNAFRSVPFTDVHLEDQFWKSRLETNQKISIPHNYKWCEETGRFDNFAKAAGLMDGKFRGIYFNDSDVYKLLEGIAYSLAANPDPQLEAMADHVIDWIAAAQQKNGYINSYYTLVEPDKKWSNTPVMHELYCIGHMIEAAVAYKQATGKMKLLDVCEKAVDHVAETFGYGDDQKREVPGHEEIEIALIKLYELTGKGKYLKLSQMFVDLRGDATRRTNKLQGPYQQDHKPVREQDEVTGHAVRAMYLYAGMADVAARTGDQELVKALDKLWDSVVNRKMYITGGIGARHEGEAFGDDYELPNASAYCETCAAIGLVLWADRMNKLHGGDEYADVVERAMYNGVISGYSLKGDLFFYPNPLSSKGNYGRQPFFDCACCPTNLVRFVPSIPGYMYCVNGNQITINLYAQSEAELQLEDGTVTIKQETNYPWDGKVKLILSSALKNPDAKTDNIKTYTLQMRSPSWQNIGNTAGRKNGYGIGPITVNWGETFVQTIDFPMPVKRIVANPNVEADRGRVALQRGPLVYCFEKCDNPKVDLNRVRLARTQHFKVEWRPDLFGGVNAIKCQDVDGNVLTAIPYYAWAHRELTGMDVWVKQDGLPRKPKTNAPAWSDAAWEGKLYRELDPATMFGESEPLTLYESTNVTASYCNGSDSVQAVFDGEEPKDSNDHAIPRMTWWSHKGTKEWFELNFEKPQTLKSISVYWFDDSAKNGGCRIPASWSFSYKNGNDWLPVKINDSFGTAKDQYNTVSFDELQTTDLRFDVQLQKDFSGGVLEIKLNE